MKFMLFETKVLMAIGTLFFPLIFKHSNIYPRTWKYLWFCSVGTMESIMTCVPCSFSRWCRKHNTTWIVPRAHPKTISGIWMSSFSPTILPFLRDTRKRIFSCEAQLRSQHWNSMAIVRNTFGVIASYGSCEWKSCFHVHPMKENGKTFKCNNPNICILGITRLKTSAAIKNHADVI